MVELKCKRCGNEWNYQGQSDYYAACSNCKTSVKIADQKIGE